MEETQSSSQRVAIVVPFFRVNQNFFDQCLQPLVERTPQGTTLVLVDDSGCGESERLRQFTHDAAQNVVLLALHSNRGPGAARNAALDWCYRNAVEILIFLDSDCEIHPQFVEDHLRNHAAHHEAICIGGSISPKGEGVWARLDGILSWFTSIPGDIPRRIQFPIHIPSTNSSVKLRPDRKDLLRFDESLRTGEDVVFIRRLLKGNHEVLFCKEPLITHYDRTQFLDVLTHQARWGLHTYRVRFESCDSLLLRIAILLSSPISVPSFAVLATYLNMKMWLRIHPRDWYWTPLVFASYLVKGCAAIYGVIWRDISLRSIPEISLRGYLEVSQQIDRTPGP